MTHTTYRLATLFFIGLFSGLVALGCRAEAKTSAPASSRAGAAAATVKATARRASTSVVRRSSSWRAPAESAVGRDRGAHARRRATVRALFQAANVSYPPAEMMLRVFKQEAQLDVWASSRRGAEMKRVTTYEICAQGDGLGPKLREGDGKTPEGFYRLDAYNGASSYHLSMRISYPNRLDRQRGRTGSAIMMHGKCVSVGCLAMTDARIEELWVMTRAARKRRSVAVHIYPARDMVPLIARARDTKLRAFWSDLKQVNDAFKKTSRMPRVRVRGKRYRLPPRARSPRLGG